ncbi:epoxide hydrolase 1 [Hypoxylon crocopeplum]|nr:epoxide hydrolase 1 [Hypoxylon crocopeplum]
MAPSQIKPYKIAVPDAALERLRAKLALTTLPRETAFSNDGNYGAPLDDVARLVRVWRDGYDWRRAEADLNDRLPQFTTTVAVDGHEDALGVHFVYRKSERPGAIPLLFVHGWPGSFLEVSKILPLLTAGGENEPSFDVVAPSLPNYGFSQGTSKPGFGLEQYAEVCHKVMLQLGYEKYVTQGGDWGFFITRMMGVLYPSHIQASHTNLIITQPPSLLSSPLLFLQAALGRFTAEERAGLARTAWFRREGHGYSTIQTTKPHTPGFALADSPVALLAWVYEKLRDWSDAYPWTDEEVLTWISIYLFSDAGADASLRIYYETVHAPTTLSGGGKGEDDAAVRGAVLRWNGNVPLGLSSFPKDVIALPLSWGRSLGPVVFEAQHKEGGHFPAYEKPELLVGDLRKMFGKKTGIGAKLPTDWKVSRSLL